MAPPAGGSAAPQKKVVAAGIGGAAATILVWLISVLFNLEVPAEVGAAIATVFSFVAGYLTPQTAGRRRGTNVDGAPD